MAQNNKEQDRGAFTIEIADRLNRSHQFDPLNKSLRGRYSFANVAGQDMTEALRQLSAVQIIPGIRLSVNLTARTLRMFDPLADRENADVMRQIKNIVHAYPGLLGSAHTRAWDEWTKEDATDDELKDWMYWMRIAVDIGSAVMVPGSLELPSIQFIRTKVPGRRRRNYGLAQALADADLWTDYVPAATPASLASGAAATSEPTGQDSGSKPTGKQAGGK